jgi:hypothetical protein
MLTYGLGDRMCSLDPLELYLAFLRMLNNLKIEIHGKLNLGNYS